MITIMMIVIGVILGLKIINLMGKGAPIIFIISFAYWLNYYVWSWLAFGIGFILSILYLMALWKDIYDGKRKEEWI